MSETAPGRPDASVVWFDVVDSTNAVATRLVSRWEDGDRGSGSDIFVVAGEQTEGHGRDGNRWSSPPGGIYATLVTNVAVEELGRVPMAAGVAAAEAAEVLLESVEVGLKWPNDLIVGGSKLGGILCHSRTAGDRCVVIVGVGLNVASVAAGTFTTPATSLQEQGFAGAVDEALPAFLATFQAAFRSAMRIEDELRARWVSRTVHVSGDRLRFRWSGGEVAGLFRGFGDDGALILEVAGKLRRFAAGELVGASTEEGE